MPPKPLEIARVPIDSNCVGDRWTVDDEALLAKLIALVAVGQAAAAAHVLKTLSRAAPAFTNTDLQREAKRKLTVQDKPSTPRIGYPRWQRDGFIFEVISWVAARQGNAQSLLKDPHVSSTSQGIDGLMLELSGDKSKVAMTTVCEDKCTSKQRSTFVQKVMPAFMDHHQNKRAAEVVATASVLLRTAGIGDAAAARMSEAVMNRSTRTYRAAFALTASSDSQAERVKLFKGFDQLDGIAAAQRIGAGLILSGKLRTSIDSLAAKAIAALDEFPAVTK
jgi:hypothetical protein